MAESSQKPKNIFEAASHIEKARAKKKPPPHHEGEEQMTVVSEIVHRGRKLHEELATQVDTLFTRSKVAPSDYRRYLSRPQNFSAQQWQEIDEQKKKNEGLLQDLAKKIGATLPEPPALSQEEIKTTQKEAAPPSMQEGPSPKETAPPEKKPPQKKPRIVTKRHWIGM